MSKNKKQRRKNINKRITHSCSHCGQRADTPFLLKGGKVWTTCKVCEESCAYCNSKVASSQMITASL